LKVHESSAKETARQTYSEPLFCIPGCFPPYFLQTATKFPERLSALSPTYPCNFLGRFRSLVDSLSAAAGEQEGVAGPPRLAY
jgi:hypothetical protein